MFGVRVSPRLRRGLTQAAGPIGVAVAVAAAFAMSFAEQVAAPVPISAQRPGTCHLARDRNELIAIPSDTAPFVSCWEPHQTETMWVTQVVGPLAASPKRPNGQLLNQTIARECSDYDRVRAYLGARPSDYTWGISMWARFPTVPEWARGDRTMVCQASADIETPIGPTIDYPLADVMRTKRSAAFRLCRGARPENITCDRPHLKEATSPHVVLPAGPWPGADAAARSAARLCTFVVADYLGHPITGRPDLQLLPEAPTQAEWDSDNRSAECWIGPRDGRSTTGTFRGGLT